MATRRTYKLPAGEYDFDALHARAAQRRAALTAAGCSTYEFGYRMGAAIVCLCCGLGSNNRHDIDARYCGFCHEFHSNGREA